MVDGFIVPDLPVEEAADYKKAAKTHGLDTIFLAAPSTSNERLTKIVAVLIRFPLSGFALWSHRHQNNS